MTEEEIPRIKPTVAAIIEAASRLSGTSMAEIKGLGREVGLVHIRASIVDVALYYSRLSKAKDLRYSTVRIGHALARDHSTILNMRDKLAWYKWKNRLLDHFIRALHEEAIAHPLSCGWDKSFKAVKWTPPVEEPVEEVEDISTKTDDELLTAAVRRHYAAGKDCLEVWNG